MPPKFTIRQSSPFFWKQLRSAFSRLFGTRLQKAKSLHVVTVNGQKFKRLILCDSYLAAELERYLDCFVESGYFPPLVARYEREIWLEYVEGTRIEAVDEPFVEQVAEFYAMVYAADSRLVETTRTPFPARLSQDLRFLSQVGALSQSVSLDLQDAIPTLMPKQVWVGYEYTDPVLKNFILLPDRQGLCVVDVDGLAKDQLLGMGVAKACVRWLGPHQERFFGHLSRPDVPDFHPYFSFVELCFLAKWTKWAFLEHKWKVIQPTLFERFRPSTSLS